MDSITSAFTTHEAKAHSILVVSEELDELFEICDRIALITKGRLPPAKPTKQTNVGEIAYWMNLSSTVSTCRARAPELDSKVTYMPTPANR